MSDSIWYLYTYCNVIKMSFTFGMLLEIFPCQMFCPCPLFSMMTMLVLIGANQHLKRMSKIQGDISLLHSLYIQTDMQTDRQIEQSLPYIDVLETNVFFNFLAMPGHFGPFGIDWVMLNQDAKKAYIDTK
eukprot:13748644-Ditylum_brightwellii.AAC.1